MGGCSSASAKESKMMMKLRLVFSTAHKGEDTIVISSPPKRKPSPNGSKEDAYFDSKAWIDSDCEDDFFSVKGDFTPSRGNTPVHHSFSKGAPQLNTSLFNESTPEPSPNKKKRLSELFEDSLKEDQGVASEDQNNDIGVNSKAENKTTVLLSSESALKKENYKVEKKNTVKSASCCLPKMLPSRSFSEKRSKMSPVPSIG